MSPLRNKKNDFPAWHPDFRLAGDLPDIKAVRTEFIINIGSIALALCLLFVVIYRETDVQVLKGDVATLRAEAQLLEPDNREAVALNAAFMKRKQIFDDLQKFYDIPVDVPLFLADVAEIRPADISFEEIAYRESEQVTKDKQERTYRIFLRGQTRNLREIDVLKQALNELPYLLNVEAEITEGANPRNPVLNTFGFSLEVLFQPRKEGDA